MSSGNYVPSENVAKAHYVSSRYEEEQASISSANAEFDRFIALTKARAWGEGAEYAWQTTGDGWNGEYAGEHGTHDGDIGFLQANGDHNPYREDT